MNILETYTCANVAGTDYVHRILVVGVHLEQTAHTFLLTGTYIIDIGTSLYLTGVNTEEGQAAYIRVCSNLECQSSRLFVFARFAVFLFAGIGVGTDDVGRIEGRGEEHTNVVEQRLYTLILERRTTGHRHDVECERTLADTGDDFLFREAVGIFKIFLHESLVLLCGSFHELGAPFFALILQLCGDVFDVVLSTHRFVVPEDSLHTDEVHDTLEFLFSTDGHRDGAGSSTEDVLHLAHYFKEVGTGAVHLVHITDTGNIVLVSLTPNGFRLRFHTTNGAIGCHSTVEHTEGAFYLSGKVNVSRSIDKVELILFAVPGPVGRSGSRGNGNTALLLLSHPVHGCTTIVYLTDFVGLTGIEEDTL